MTRDAKLQDIEIKRHDFTTEKQERVAHILIEEWEENGPRQYTDLEDKYDDLSRQMISKVMTEYIGPPDHDVTVGDIREEYGSIRVYNEARMKGEVELDIEEEGEDTRELTKRELKLWKEGYSEGYQDGMKEAN